MLQIYHYTLEPAQVNYIGDLSSQLTRCIEVKYYPLPYSLSIVFLMSNIQRTYHAYWACSHGNQAPQTDVGLLVDFQQNLRKIYLLPWEEDL